MTELNKKIKLLKIYFSQRQEVSMAFVFGSFAKGLAISESDFDIAVYFKPKGSSLEWEEVEEYESEDEMWGEIEKLVGRKTDFVVLNRAPSTLFYSVLQEGIPIIIKDKLLHLRLFLAISSAAEYFREFVSDFWKIKQRSFSLNEIDKERLIKIIDFLETELADYKKFYNLDQRVYETDSTTRRNVERWAENIVNSSIDVAKILLASEKQRIPQTYREILEELALLPDFDAETAKKLSQFAKLRNILAHEYLDIRFIQIKKFIDESETVYKKLVDFVKKIL
jgi:uncharacterized protein YutE (UPF0331/DUF86 family)/predicted nucleotidyltransferase